MAALALMTAGCAEVPGGSDSSGAGTTRPTIREEITTTTTVVAPDQNDLGAIPIPDWESIRFDLEPIAETDQGLAMAVRPPGDDLWLVERPGRVRVVQRRVSLDNEAEAVKLMNTVVLDITDKVSTDGEGGLLGLAFSTDGSHLYVSYTDRDGNTVIAEYRMDLLTAIEDTERILLQVEQPYSNHNGGQITFGPDGFLYIALGDGGSGGDPLGSGQDTSTLLGSILRIDPFAGDAETAYGIPADNPYAGQRGGPRPEIWLYGVRNPWRFSFDSANGDLWVADVGQSDWEEVTHLRATSQVPAGRGANLGWNIMEGDALFEGDRPPTGHVGPLITYGHDDGRCSVTGGYVYRGEQNKDLAGVYLYADYCTGEVFGLLQLAGGRIIEAPVSFNRRPGQIVSFGQGPEGELYLFEADGTLSRIQSPDWERELAVYGADEQIPGGQFELELTPGPDDPVINADPSEFELEDPDDEGVEIGDDPGATTGGGAETGADDGSTNPDE